MAKPDPRTGITAAVRELLAADRKAVLDAVRASGYTIKASAPSDVKKGSGSLRGMVNSAIDAALVRQARAEQRKQNDKK